MGETREFEEEQDASTPAWINVALITEALKGFGEENLQVTGFTVKHATKPGDNYGSTIYRVTATLRGGQKRNLLLKGLPPGNALSDIMTNAGIFEREGFMLAEIIPKIETLLEEMAPGRWGPLAARCPMYSASDSAPYIVLEDLASPGFRLAEKMRGLGLRHSLMALRALARYHAGSHVLLKREPELYQRLDNSFWRVNSQGMETFLKQGLQATADRCKIWPGYEDYAKILEKFKEVAITKYTELNDPKPGAFNVIIHGDYWMNNMMFRYDDEGEVCDHRFVDLQLSHVASPAIDVLYFLSGSTSEDVSIRHIDLLIREYYFALQEALTLLGEKAPAFEQLLSDLDAHGSYSLFFAVSGLPALRAEKAPDIDSSFQGDSSALQYMYDNPSVERWFKRVLPEYRRKGWLPE